LPSPTTSPIFPYTTLFPSLLMKHALFTLLKVPQDTESSPVSVPISRLYISRLLAAFEQEQWRSTHGREASSATTHKTLPHSLEKDRKSTRLNSSHRTISYA